MSLVLDWLYTLSIHLYGLALRIAAVFHPKARRWVRGRKKWDRDLQAAVDTHTGPWIWFHCASLGEFEQGRNLIEALRKIHPEYKILLSFFSPSGYEIRKNYAQADYVCYLPLDTPANARRFVSLFKPQLIVFIKYELWLNYLREIGQQQIPFILVAARVRADSFFLTSIFRSRYRRAFSAMSHIFTQDQVSKELIQDFSGNPSISVSSDTRYDRVTANRAEFIPIEAVNRFKGDRLCIVGGSTWPAGESLLMESYRMLRDSFNYCMILAPHEIHESRIAKWEAEFPEESIRFSRIDQLTDTHRILWIDNIGMLSRLYHYGDLAYVGGGWGTGLHNILEATVFGCPVLIGPKHSKFPEAGELIDAGGCFAIRNQNELTEQIRYLLDSSQHRSEIQRINKAFIEQRKGATEKVLSWIQNAQILD